MHIKSKRIKKSNIDFDIEGNYELFLKIVTDMENKAGFLKPAINWGLEISNHDGMTYFKSKKIKTISNVKDIYEIKYSTFKKMLDPWVGCIGMQSATNETLFNYFFFLKVIDELGILSTYVNKKGKLKSEGLKLLNTDFGTLIDLNLISSFQKNKKKLSVIEVGGGYGRLAEGFFEAFGDNNIKYLLLDSVPSSLLYCYKYLSKNFPKLKIGFYYNDDVFDLNKFDCYIMPTWHYKPNREKFDVCVNIQSFQEMNQDHIDYYLQLFNRVLRPDGIVYLHNEKDYLFKGQWNYPKSWNKYLNLRTPRSWTRDSPTEIFSKKMSKELYHLAADITYKSQLSDYDKSVQR
jgi:SAM-dependent methyltransferase